MLETATQEFRNLMSTQIPNEEDYSKNTIGKKNFMITLVFKMLLLDNIFFISMHETLCDIHVHVA